MRPNVVIIMTDQQRADFSRRAGFAADTTPFLDALAARGTNFPAAYTASPACVPARTSLLTGRFPIAHRVTQNSNASDAYYSQDLVDVLRDAGYGLMFAGKPHMHRTLSDFDSYAGPYSHTGGPEKDADDAQFDKWLADLNHGVSRVPTPFPLEHHLPYRIVSDAIEQVNDFDADKPAFLWVSFPEPHNPYQVPEPYFSMFPEEELPARRHGPDVAQAKGGHWSWLQQLIESKRPGYDEEWRRYRANYCGQLRLLDDQIKRLVEHVNSALSGDTLFIFLSDHGDYVGEYGLQRKGAGMPECLMRIPMFFSGAGAVVGQTRDELVSIVDILPTVCELLREPIPAGVQGRSLLPLLEDASVQTDEFTSVYAERGYGGLTYGADEMPALHFPLEGRRFDELNTVTQSGRTKMIRCGRYKMLLHSTGQGELYDLESDPTEVDNLFEDPHLKEIREDLTMCLLQWLMRLQDELPTGKYTVKTAQHNWAGIGAAPGSSVQHKGVSNA